jgi:hypothetical protein
MDQRTPAAMNWDSGAAHRRRLRHKFPAMPKRRVQLLGSGSFWMARGSRRGGCRGLWHGGAAARRRGKEGDAAEPRGGGARGLVGGEGRAQKV